ncbi:hypothetical protein [Raoultibacter phocaeensis]|uniref:hypothetical protein n=1 Tax=Raoultibacter phocaeensis TaxID=2479841 RepID=UPI001118E960|nr:hypothetical protein [Raoultibacter phocaeensis]
MNDSHDTSDTHIGKLRENSHTGAHGRNLEFTQGTASLEGHTHAMASVVSLRVSLHPDTSTEFDALVSSLEALARDIECEGGVVGHIKALASCEAGSVRISIVDACRPALVRGPAPAALNDEACLDIAVIALAIDLDLLIGLVCEAMKCTLG